MLISHQDRGWVRTEGALVTRTPYRLALINRSYRLPTMRVQNSHSHLTDVPRIKQELRRLTTGPRPLGTPLLHSPKTVSASISRAFRYLAPALHVPSTPLPNSSPIQTQPPALNNSTQPVLPRPPARGKGCCPFLVVLVDDALPFPPT